MAQRVSDQIVARLRAWGVEQVFGYPGDGVNGIVGAIAAAGSPSSATRRAA